MESAFRAMAGGQPCRESQNGPVCRVDTGSSGICRFQQTEPLLQIGGTTGKTNMRILITGGAGFVGSSLARLIKRDQADAEVVAFDNLARRGSELAIPRLRALGANFVHGDVRCFEDLEALGHFDLILDCAAEPSVKAGYEGGARSLVQTNLDGTIHCLELARRHDAALIFLSTSRVYPIEALRALPLETRGDRLTIPEDRSGPGWSVRGISSAFPMDGPRSLYGATKYASELLAAEFASMYDLPIVTNRCGVIAGPWQMGKVDQGFVVLWAARHFFGGDLAYCGFGGDGRQVRDILHIEDLYALVSMQMASPGDHLGARYCVGGGPECSVSPLELTRLCVERGRETLDIGSVAKTHPADIPYYCTDLEDVSKRTGWHPERGVEDIVDDIFRWLSENERALKPILG